MKKNYRVYLFMGFLLAHENSLWAPGHDKGKKRLEVMIPSNDEDGKLQVDVAKTDYGSSVGVPVGQTSTYVAPAEEGASGDQPAMPNNPIQDLRDRRVDISRQDGSGDNKLLGGVAKTDYGSSVGVPVGQTSTYVAAAEEGASGDQSAMPNNPIQDLRDRRVDILRQDGSGDNKLSGGVAKTDYGSSVGVPVGQTSTYVAPAEEGASGDQPAMPNNPIQDLRERRVDIVKQDGAGDNKLLAQAQSAPAVPAAPARAQQAAPAPAPAPASASAPAPASPVQSQGSLPPQTVLPEQMRQGAVSEVGSNQATVGKRDVLNIDKQAENGFNLFDYTRLVLGAEYAFTENFSGVFMSLVGKEVDVLLSGMYNFDEKTALGVSCNIRYSYGIDENDGNKKEEMAVTLGIGPMFSFLLLDQVRVIATGGYDCMKKVWYAGIVFSDNVVVSNEMDVFFGLGLHWDLKSSAE